MFPITSRAWRIAWSYVTCLRGSWRRQGREDKGELGGLHSYYTSALQGHDGGMMEEMLKTLLLIPYSAWAVLAEATIRRTTRRCIRVRLIIMVRINTLKDAGENQRMVSD